MSNVGQQLLSGALSGFATTICLQPFDFLKTRMQQGDGSEGVRKTVSVVHTVRHVVATEGVFGLWKGTSVTLIRNVPGVALYMTSLTQLRTFIASSPHFSRFHKARSESQRGNSVLPSLTFEANLVSGATSRVFVGFLLNPFTVLKARYESDMHSYKSLPSAISSILRGGPSELFRGFWASSLRDAPYAGLFVVFYEGIKREAVYLLPHSDSASTSAAIHSFSAASAGGIATLLTHPFDVIKTKIQVRPEARYQGLWSTTKSIWIKRGFIGFLDGASLRLSRKIFSSAIGWVVYEGLLIAQNRRGSQPT